MDRNAHEWFQPTRARRFKTDDPIPLVELVADALRMKCPPIAVMNELLDNPRDRWNGAVKEEMARGLSQRMATYRAAIKHSQLRLAYVLDSQRADYPIHRWLEVANAALMACREKTLKAVKDRNNILCVHPSLFKVWYEEWHAAHPFKDATQTVKANQVRRVTAEQRLDALCERAREIRKREGGTWWAAAQKANDELPQNERYRQPRVIIDELKKRGIIPPGELRKTRP